MAVHPSHGHWDGTLVHALMHRFQKEPLDLNRPPKTLSSPLTEMTPSDGNGEIVFRPGIVHRLDIGTSGLLIVAKNDTAHARLGDQFRDRKVKIKK